MGSYSELIFDDYPLFSNKNGMDSNLASYLFQKSDYIEEERLVADRNIIVWGESIKGNKNKEISKCLKTTVKQCKDRLEMFGASYKNAKYDFENAIKELVQEGYMTFLENESITYEYYLSQIKLIFQSKRKYEIHDFDRPVDWYFYECDYVIDYQNPSFGLYSILSTLDDSANVIYDLTEVCNGGWIGNVIEHVEPLKIIVFTEGKTDTEFIKICIDKFYPHLKESYHFIDFETSSYEASASRLIHTIKSFIGSGIDKKLVFLFDNDSAAEKEINHLNTVQLPQNIKVLKYPDIDICKNYPTIGPNGHENMDINGLAGSIELYLGEDCLTENEALLPIQWTEYVKSIEKYQGSIIDKSKVQNKFRIKAKSTIDLEDPSKWRHLIQIVNSINEAWK